MPKFFRNQKYASLKAASLKVGALFEDPLFSATDYSITITGQKSDIEWLRPKELCRVPKLIVEGVGCDDLICDDVSRSWFPSACMGLALEPKLWNKVVPDSTKQEWDDKNQYAGIFKFCIWRFGEWIEVVVDDRLPTKDEMLIFTRSSDKNEFWSALLEKAYAKLIGSYQPLMNGDAVDAMVDFTGGVAEKIDLNSVTYSDPTIKNSVFQKLKDAYENKSLLCCHIQTDRLLAGTNGPNGLVKGLSYNITMVKEVELKSTQANVLGTNNLRLIRLFAPTSSSKWTGPWSDKSQEMNKLSTIEWEKMGIKYDMEGAFWMSFQDLVSVFTNIGICRFPNTSVFSIKKSWTESVLNSSWSNDGRNGSTEWEGNTFLNNPQIMFDITQDQDTVMVSLEQDDRGDTFSSNTNKKTIGFYIMKVEVNRKFRVHIKGDLAFKSEFMSSRNVFGKTELSRGRYVIIPCCNSKTTTELFLLRIYTSSNPALVELRKECPDSGCCRPKYKMVTSIDVKKADGIALPETIKGSLDPLVIIRCEGQRIQSDFKKNTASPKFDTKATFYRKDPSKPIIVEVLSRNRVKKNTFLGMASVDVQAYITKSGRSAGPGPDVRTEGGTEWGEEGQTKVYNLYGRDKQVETQMPGTLQVFTRSSYDLALL